MAFNWLTFTYWFFGALFAMFVVFLFYLMLNSITKSRLRRRYKPENDRGKQLPAPTGESNSDNFTRPLPKLGNDLQPTHRQLYQPDSPEPIRDKSNVEKFRDSFKKIK